LNEQLMIEVGIHVGSIDEEPEPEPKLYEVLGPRGGVIVPQPTAADYLNALRYQLDTHKDATAVWKKNIASVEGIAKRGGSAGESAVALLSKMGGGITN
jgi:hypothetical protein